MSDDENFPSGSSDLEDSDTELQRAFKEGRLKPGLNYEKPAPPKFINNVAGMQQKFKEIQQQLPWLERLDITCPPAPSLSLEHEEVDDDFKREMVFYRQAQAAVFTAIPRLHKLDVQTKRPEDFFAEMAKPDSHMLKVREKLNERKTAMERSEAAKKLREQKKYGKKVQQEVLQKRQREKREMLDAVKKYKKGNKSKLNEFLGEGPESKQSSAKSKPRKKSRDFKNKKYGFGGQKKRSKRNTKESYEGKPSGKKGKMKQMRPGKARRKVAKNKNKKK